MGPGLGSRAGQLSNWAVSLNTGWLMGCAAGKGLGSQRHAPPGAMDSLEEPPLLPSRVDTVLGHLGKPTGGIQEGGAEARAQRAQATAGVLRLSPPRTGERCTQECCSPKPLGHFLPVHELSITVFKLQIEDYFYRCHFKYNMKFLGHYISPTTQTAAPSAHM